MDILSTTSRRLSGLFLGPKTSFQILSDLNLDYQSQYHTFHIPVAAPFLILAGNNGRLIDYDQYLSFLVRRCNLHEKVFLVLGPLEFHGLGWMDGLQLAHKLEKEPATKGKLEVLYETRSEVPGTNIILLGCTMWSKIPAADAAAVLKKIPEFDETDGIQGWSVEMHNSEHKRDLRWLIKELNNSNSSPKPPPAAATLAAPPAGPATPKADAQQLVVVTSFAPDLRECMDPWQRDAPWASAYGTNLLNNNSHFNNVKAWISGSTGRTYEVKKGNMTLVSNQRGREGEHVTGLLKEGMSEKQRAGLFDVMRVIKI